MPPDSHDASHPAPAVDASVDPLRRRIMRRVRGRDTGPELAVRRFLHRAGYRFRLHDRRLPGSPDLVLRRHRTVVFVHGCFWHRHPGCRRTTTPKTRREFWQTKFAANVARDAAAVRALEALGWRVVVVWECRTRSSADLVEALGPLLSSVRNRRSPRSRTVGDVAESGGLVTGESLAVSGDVLALGP